MLLPRCAARAPLLRSRADPRGLPDLPPHRDSAADLIRERPLRALRPPRPRASFGPGPPRAGPPARGPGPPPARATHLAGARASPAELEEGRDPAEPGLVAAWGARGGRGRQPLPAVRRSP